MKSRMKSRTCCLVAAVVLCLSACGDDDGGVVLPVDDGCEHMQDGPFASITANAVEGQAPSMPMEHTKYMVTLVDDGGNFGGFVSIPIADAGELFVYSDNTAPLTLRDDSGSPVVAELEDTSISACTEVDREKVYDVDVGTYTVELGPYDQARMSLVYFTVVGEDDHNH